MKNNLTIFAVLLIALAIIAAPALAQPAPTRTCSDVCKQVYPDSSGGDCILPGQPTGIRTPYTALQNICPSGQSCWCNVDPSLICDQRCKSGEFGASYQGGSCSPTTTCGALPNVPAPGYGYVQQNYPVPRSQLSCGINQNIGCCCRNVNDQVYSQVQNLVSAVVLTLDKSCEYSAADGTYIVRLSGLWGGGQALRVDVPGGIPTISSFPGIAPTAPGYPPAGLFGAGPFFQVLKVPRRIVESKPDRTIDARITVIPYPQQALQSYYVQSLAPQYPTNFGQTLTQNTYTETIACEGAPLPTPIQQLPPAEGPKEIKLLRAECGPKATTYQNEAHLTDFNRESWFQFAPAAASTQAGTSATTETFALGGTGTPGSAPPGHIRPPGEQIEVTVSTPGQAPGGNVGQGSCTFNFVGAQEFYGAEITAWDNTDNITLKAVQVGATIFPIGIAISPNGTTITFSDYNISTPVRGSAIRFHFTYTGAPALAELNPLPDVALITLNVTPTRAIRGTDILIQGTVSERDFTAPSGRLLYCEYQWEGGCYPCVGRDCKPDPTKFIGKPDFIFIMPLAIPGVTFDFGDINDFFAKGRETKNANAGIANLTRGVTTAPGTGENVARGFASIVKDFVPPVVQKWTYDVNIKKTNPNDNDPIKTSTRFTIAGTFSNIAAITVITSVNLLANDWSKPAWPLTTSILSTVPFLVEALIQLVAGGIFGADINLLEYSTGAGCIQGGMLACAIANSIEVTKKPNDDKRCRLAGGQGSSTADSVRYACDTYYALVSWFDIDSDAEPDPDGVGDYSLKEATCPKPNGFDKWLFNAGWWSLFGQLGDMLQSIKQESVDKERQNAANALGALSSCQTCVKGIVTGRNLTPAEGAAATQKCREFAGNIGKEIVPPGDPSGAEVRFVEAVCVNKVGSVSYAFAPVGTCPTGEATIKSADECESKIDDFVSTNTPGIWCAQPIVIGGNQTFASEGNVIFNGQNVGGGKCVFDEACPGGWKSISAEAQCNADLITAAQITAAKANELFAGLNSCSDCTTQRSVNGVQTKGQWCAKLELDASKRVVSYNTLGCRADCAQAFGMSFMTPPRASELSRLTSGTNNFKYIEGSQCAVENIYKSSVGVAADSVTEGALNLIAACSQCIDNKGIWCATPDGSTICTSNENSCHGEKTKSIATTKDKCAAVSAFASAVRSGEFNKTQQIAKLEAFRLQLVTYRTNLNSVITANRNPTPEFTSLATNILSTISSLELQVNALKLQIEAELNTIRLQELGSQVGSLTNALPGILAQIQQLNQLVQQSLGTPTTNPLAQEFYSGTTPITFTWNAVPGADNYILTLVRPTGTINLPSGSTASLTITDPASVFTTEGEYQWKIIAYKGGVPSPPSAVRTFKVDKSAPLLQLTQPQDNAFFPVTSIALAWTRADTNFKESRLKIETGGQAIVDQVATSPHTPFNIPLAGTYKWTVTATDMAGNSNTLSRTFHHYAIPEVQPVSITSVGFDHDIKFKYNPAKPDAAYIPSVKATLFGEDGELNEEKSGAPTDEFVLRADECDPTPHKLVMEFTIAEAFGGGKYTRTYEYICKLDRTFQNFRKTAGATELPPGFEVPEAPGTAQPFGSPITGQLTDFEFAEGGETGEDLAQLGQIPSTGLVPGFGTLPATGMQLGGVGGTGSSLGGTALFQQALSKTGANMQQLSASLATIEELKKGFAKYTRGFYVQPGLSPVCPSTDPQFRGKAKLSRQFAASTKADEVVVSEAYPYWTSEGGIEPINTTVYITIRNSSGAIVTGACRLGDQMVDCNRVPTSATTDGVAGVYRYIFSAPYNDAFTIRASASGSAGTSAGGTVVAGPKPPLGIQVQSPFLCGKPGDEKRFVVTLTEPEGGVPNANYRLELSPSSQDTGFLVFDTQGNQILSPSLSLPISSGSSTQVIISSKVSSDTTIRLTIRNETYGEDREVNLSHKISFREQPKLVLKNPGSAQSTLSEVEYVVQLNNNVPSGCDPSFWAIEKEAPTPSGWNIFFNSSQNDIATLRAIGGNGTTFPLHAIPLTLPSIGRYPIYVHASEFSPEKFKDTGDAVSIAADSQNVYYVTQTGILRVADRLTGNTIERTAGQNPTAVAIDAARVYFSAGGRIASTLKAGSFSPQDIAIGTFPSQIAVDNTDVYWIESSSIKRATKLPNSADCSGNNCAIITGVPALDIALDANYIYWTERTQVKRALKANPSIIETIFTGKQNLRGLAMFAGELYTTYEAVGSGKIVKLAANGTVEDVLGDVNTEVRDFAYAISRNSPTDLTVSSDGTRIYWVEGRAIYAMPVDTLAGITVIYYQFSPFAPSVVIIPDKALAAKGDVARFAVNITNRADIPVFFVLNLSPAPPQGWTATLSQASAQVSRSGQTSAVVQVTSPADALPNASYAFCVRAQNGTGLFGISGQGCSSYFISPHERPSVTLTILQDTPLPAGPGATVGWTAAVRNNDPPEFLSAAPINLSFELPEGWKGFFLTPDSKQLKSLQVTIPSATTNNSIKFFATSSKSSPDGSYEVKVKAGIEGLVGEGTATYSIVGCGNNICEPDRGETQRNTDGTPADLWCEADCALGYNNFRCTYFKNSSSLSWLECDTTRERDVQFRSEISIPNAAQLTSTAALACKRGSTPEACRAAADAGNCGLSVTGFSGALADCIAPLQLTGTGVAGPRYEGTMNCAVDYDGEYYLLFSGSQTSLGPDLSPQFTPSNTISANYTFSCPAYRLQELADKQAQWQSILEGCAGRVQQLNGIGQRTCADVVRQTCLLRENLIAEMGTLLQTPNATRSDALIERVKAVEEFIASRLQVTCFGIPGLQITGVVPPGTQVGESTIIKVKVNNSFVEDYRGYASCEVELPGGLRRQLPGICTTFYNLTSTEAPIPVTLTDQGSWQITSCAVYADLAGSLPESDCYAAPLFTSAISDVTFDVQPAEAFLTIPSDGTSAKGSAQVEAAISGFFEGYNFSYSLISPGCFGGPLLPLETPDIGFTRTYSGAWDTTALPDKPHYACLMLTVSGQPFAVDTATAIVDNYNFAVSEAVSNRNVGGRGQTTFAIDVTNTGRDDDYVITCEAPPGWATTISSSGQEAACGQQLRTSLGSGLKTPITVKTNVPDQQSGSALLKLSITNSQGETLETKHTLTISGTANNPPTVTNAELSPARVSSGSAITFRATLSDPDGDSVTSAKVCSDENCTTARCTMAFGASQWSCTAQIVGDPGTYSWYIEARDNLGTSAVLGTAKPFEISGIGPQLKCETPNTCLPSCEPDADLCINRTSFGRRDCALGRVCCRTEQIPACTPAQGCVVKIDSAKCTWDPVQKNYSVSAQVSWSGGAYVRISAADLTSERIFERTATHAVKTTTPGAHVIAASVSAANDDVLCTNITQTTCVPPGSEPPGSGVTSPKLAIVNAIASSFQPGKVAANAIDGDQFTQWQSASGLPQWLRIDLGSPKVVSGVGIYTLSNKPADFFIDTSTDCVRFRNVARIRGATYKNDWNITRFAQRDAKCILLNFTKSESDSVSIFEVEIYGGAAITGGVTTLPAEEIPLLPVAIAAVVAIAALAIIFIYRRRIRLWWKYVRAK